MTPNQSLNRTRDGTSSSGLISFFPTAPCRHGPVSFNGRQHMFVRHWFAIGFLVLGGTAAAKQACLPPTMEQPDFLRAETLVSRLPELKKWAKSHHFPVAYGTTREVAERNGRCYLPVTVSADRPERHELWHIFYVHPSSKSMLVMDPVSGDLISLHQWRAKSR